MIIELFFFIYCIHNDKFTILFNNILICNFIVYNITNGSSAIAKGEQAKVKDNTNANMDINFFEKVFLFIIDSPFCEFNNFRT